MGKTSDQTVVQKTIIDTLHKEGKTQKVVAERAGCSQSIEAYIHGNFTGREKCGKKRCTSNRDDPKFEKIVKQSRFKNLGELHNVWTEAGVSASRATMHAQTSSGKGIQLSHSYSIEPLLNKRQRQKRRTWAKEKKNWTVAQWSKVLFSDESKFCISFGNQGPRVWRKNGEGQKSSVTFPQSVMIWGAMSSVGVASCCVLSSPKLICAKRASTKYWVHIKLTYFSDVGHFCIVNPFLIDLMKYSNILR